MEDCRWFTRGQVADAVQAIAAQADAGDPYAGGAIATSNVTVHPAPQRRWAGDDGGWS